VRKRRKLNTEFRILQTKSKELDLQFYVNTETSNSSKSHDDDFDLDAECDNMIDDIYDKSANYPNEVKTLELKLNIEKERTQRTIIDKQMKEKDLEIQREKSKIANDKRMRLLEKELLTKNKIEQRKTTIHNNIRDFIDSYFEKTDYKKDYMSISKMYENMRIWYRTNYSDFRANKDDLRLYVHTQMGCYSEIDDKMIKYRIKEYNESDSINDVEELDKHI